MSVQSLVELTESGAVVKQDFQRALSLPEEHEQRAAAGGTTDLLFDQAAQPIKSPSKINRLETDEDFDTAGDHERSPQAVAAKAASTVESA